MGPVFYQKEETRMTILRYLLVFVGVFFLLRRHCLLCLKLRERPPHRVVISDQEQMFDVAKLIPTILHNTLTPKYFNSAACYYTLRVANIICLFLIGCH